MKNHKIIKRIGLKFSFSVTLVTFSKNQIFSKLTCYRLILKRIGKKKESLSSFATKVVDTANVEMKALLDALETCPCEEVDDLDEDGGSSK